MERSGQRAGGHRGGGEAVGQASRTVHPGTGRQLFARSNLREPRSQRLRQIVLNLGRDQAGFVEILQVGFILRPEAGDLHTNQFAERDQANAMKSSKRSDGWCRSAIARLYLLTPETHLPPPPPA